MDALLATLIAWIVAKTDLAAPSDLPKVLLLPKHKMVEIYYGTSNPNSDFELEAFYDPFTATIYLSDAWQPDLLGQSVLLHEAGHHLQRFNKLRFQCRGAAERQAYGWQAAWLQEQGIDDPYAAMRIDAFTVRIAFMCADEE